MAKGDYKGTILAGDSTYRAWRAMFVAECKSEKLWKYIDGSAILPGPDPRQTTRRATTTTSDPAAGTAETESDSDRLVNKTALEAWLGEKETYEVGFEQAKKKCFMSVDKTHLATILELSDPKDMFDALDQKYSASNAARLRQLLRDCQAVSTQKNVGVMEKYESMLNLNAEIRVQKPELAFRDEHLTNFLLASMPSTYEGIIDNLNMRDILTLEETVRALRTKETELTDLGVIKEESAHFAARGGFRGGRGGRGGAGIRTISRTADGGYTVQSYSSRPTINCFHCKKDGHGWRDCTLYFATEERKKWKASDKGKLWAARSTSSNTVQELASLAIAVDEDEPEEVDICLSSTHDHIVEASQLASDEAILHSSYSQVVSAFLTPSATSTQPSRVALIAGIDIWKSESSSWHLDSAYSRHLTSEQNVFIGRLAESSTKIECANGDYLLAKREGKIRLSCLKEDGNRYMWTATDQATGRVWTKFRPNKKEILQSIRDWKDKAEKESKCRLQAIHIDRGGEFFNTAIKEWCQSLQIKLETTVGYFPEANGIAERCNQTILEKANAMRFEAGLPGPYWELA